MATIPHIPGQAGETTEEAQPAQQAQQARQAAAPRLTRRVRYGQPFFPAVPFGSAFFILATAIALVMLAITNPAPLQNPADPLNHQHINPRPEWYFLFLFQILKIFQGPFELIGTLVIPGVIGLVLLGLPFYDRNWSRRAKRRPAAVGIMSGVLVLLAILTYIPIAGTAQPSVGNALLATVSPHPKFANVEAIFAKNCAPCHTTLGTAGLSLTSYAGVMKGGSISAGGVVNGAVIKPGDPEGSFLWQAVAGKQKLGARMPANGQILPNVDIQNIYNWIKDGAKNS